MQLAAVVPAVGGAVCCRRCAEPQATQPTSSVRPVCNTDGVGRIGVVSEGAMAARVASGPARHVRQTGAVAGRDGTSRVPRPNHAGPPSTRSSPHAANTSREVRADRPPAAGSGFKIRVKSAPKTASASSPQRSGMRQGSARSLQETSHDQDSPSVNASAASDYRGHGTNPRLAKSRNSRLSTNKPASSPDKKAAVSVKKNSIPKPTNYDGVSPKQNHQPTKAQTTGKKGPAPKVSKIPKPTSGKPQFTKNELSDLMAVVDKFSENPADSADNDSERERSDEREPSFDRSPSPASDGRGRSRSGDDSDGSETRKLGKETTWRHGDESTGELGLGGISRREREERAREPRPRKETPFDISTLADQITPSNKTRDDKNNKRKTPEVDSEDRGLSDLMDLAEGYEATRSPKTDARKPAPKTAPKPKLSKSELDQLLNFIDSEELSGNHRNSSEEEEATDNVNSVNTWRTGDGDDAAMNKLRTKPRNRNAPSQPPKWALEDLITDEYAAPASSSRNRVMPGNQVDPGSDSDASESDGRSAATQEDSGELAANNDKRHNLSRFDDFISDTLYSPNTVKDKPTTANHPVKKKIVKPEHVPPRSKQVVEGPLRASRASDRGCAVPPRTTRSRSGSDERPHRSHAKQDASKDRRESGLGFFDEIIPEKESTAQAAPTSSRQKEHPLGSEKPRRAVGRWEEKGSRGAPPSRFRGPSHKDGDRHSEDRSRKRDDTYFTNQRPSPKKLQSTGLRSSPVKPAKSRSISPAKSTSPAKSRSVTPQKYRSSPSPVKSRSTSPAKSRSTSPKKDTKTPKSYIDATQKPWPRDNPNSDRWRRSRTPSPPKRSPAVDGDVLRVTSRDGRNSYNLRSRTRERPARTPSPSEENPTAKKPTTVHHPVNSVAEERKPEVIYRNRTEDRADNRPKRKSLSLAGMSNPDRDDEGQKLR